MAYLVSYRGLTVTCNDAHEVDQLADRAGRKPASPSTIREAVSQIGESGRQLLLKLLNDKRTPMPQSVLVSQMNLTAVQLPGVLTAIAKPLKDAGLKKSDLLNIVAPRNGGERMYSLVPAAIDD